MSCPRYRFVFSWLVMLTLGLAPLGNAHSADNPANPLITDRGLFRPLILITPSLDNADYRRIREQLQDQRFDAVKLRLVVQLSHC